MLAVNIVYVLHGKYSMKTVFVPVVMNNHFFSLTLFKVGDIPGSRKLHRSVISGGRRSMSREELSSNPDAITPQSRTLSRSISVLAPWRPKHNRQEINYDNGGNHLKPQSLKSQWKTRSLILKKTRVTKSREATVT